MCIHGENVFACLRVARCVFLLQVGCVGGVKSRTSVVVYER